MFLLSAKDTLNQNSFSNSRMPNQKYLRPMVEKSTNNKSITNCINSRNINLVKLRVW